MPIGPGHAVERLGKRWNARALGMKRGSVVTVWTAFGVELFEFAFADCRGGGAQQP